MSRRIVLDASAALHAVLPGPAAEPVLDALASAAVVLAPDLYCLEVANALWKYVGAGELEAEEAGGRLERALALVDALTPVAELAKESLVTAAEAGHPVYDCAYAVLARREGATVLTADGGFAAALGKLRTPVIAVTAAPSPKKAHGPRPPAPRRRQS